MDFVDFDRARNRVRSPITSAQQNQGADGGRAENLWECTGEGDAHRFEQKLRDIICSKR